MAPEQLLWHTWAFSGGSGVLFSIKTGVQSPQGTDGVNHPPPEG